MAKKRPFDIVIFGATGFTGRLTALYLAQSGAKVPWAIAGRSAAKLAAVKDDLVAANEACDAVGILEADCHDLASLREMARQARVVVTTVGPFEQYGEPLVQACILEGTDYLDITGEPQFVDRVIRRYDTEARQKGVRIINCCGFDSIPHDLGALYTVDALRSRMSPEETLQLPVAVEGFVRAGGTFSGGTWQSAILGMSQFREHARERKAARAAGGSAAAQANGRRVRVQQAGIKHRPELGGWACPMPTIDPQIVRRSAKALPEYGPDFRYGHFFLVKRLPTLLAGMVGVGALFTLAQVKATRDLLLKVRSSGEGPDDATRERGWFEVRFVGSAGRHRVVTAVRGGDPGYTETSKMLAESALCLVADDKALPKTAGVVTPAVAMGRVLTERLQAAGLTFTEVEYAEQPATRRKVT